MQGSLENGNIEVSVDELKQKGTLGKYLENTKQSEEELSSEQKVVLTVEEAKALKILESCNE